MTLGALMALDSGSVRAGKVFVGRRHELDLLSSAWESARQGEGRLVAIEGEQGIGKTELVEEFLARAGVRAVTVHGEDGDLAVPWVVLKRLIKQLPATATGDLVALDPQANSTVIGDWLSGVLHSGESLVVFVDDAQWADEQSLAVLMEAGPRLGSARVLLLVAYQPNDRSPFDASAGSALPAAWRRMLGNDRVQLLSISELPAEDILRLAAASGWPGLSPGDAAKLRARIGGNPDYLLALLPMLEWKPILIGVGPLPVPAGRAEGITSKFLACSPETRQLLSAASVFGRRIRVAALRELSGLEDPWPHIEEAAGRGLVEVVPGSDDGELRFPRQVTGDAIYGTLDRETRVGWHRRCAARGGPGALRHKILAMNGVDEGFAADLRRAASQCTRDHDFGGAAYYLLRAMDCTQPGFARTALLLRAVEALLVVGKQSIAIQYREELEQSPANPWRDYVLGYLLMPAGEPATATALLRGALDALDRGTPVPPDAPTDLRARIAAQLGVLGIVLLNYREMITDGLAAIEAPSDDPAVRGLAWVARTLGMALSGSGGRALAQLSDAGEPGSASGLEGLAARGIIRLWTDDLPGAAADLRRVFDRCARGEALRTSQAIGFLSELEYRQGHLSEAARIAGIAVDNARANDRYWDYPLLHALAVYPLAARAEWDQAGYHAGESANMAQWIGARGFLAYAAAARAAIAQARGDRRAFLAAARDMEANFDAREPGAHLFGPVVADALAQLFRLDKPEEELLDEAEEELRRFRGRLVVRDRKTTQVATLRVIAEIAIARADHARARKACADGRTLASKVGLPLEAARIGMIMARAHYRRDDRRLAEQELRAAFRAFVGMEAKAYAWLARRQAHDWDMRLDDILFDAGLTTSERRTCVLLSRGLTTSDIATKLTITKKTVENHQSSALRKLGIVKAAELRELLGGEPEALTGRLSAG
jgi:DNA-binding CsgD family transcriptional regulator